jgi:hypothetical protein
MVACLQIDKNRGHVAARSFYGFLRASIGVPLFAKGSERERGRAYKTGPSALPTALPQPCFFHTPDTCFSPLLKSPYWLPNLT